ncbi:hypothetical protein M5689_025341 [Euphorbia peplus]|nr:hypothetical protein M5689_025341 [Euphorbia peplus]
MVGVFKRSLSFPNKIPNNRPPKPQLSHHIRSISLPSRSHPLISQLRQEITDLRTSNTPSSSNSDDSLHRLKLAHDSLDDILQLPQTQDSLRRQPIWVEQLLRDFLRFVDVYGIFRSSILGFKEDQLAAQIAVRRRDDSRIAMYVKSRKRMGKEMVKLANTIRGISPVKSATGSSISDVEVIGVIGDVVEFTVAVSLGIFNGMSFGERKTTSSWMGLRLPKRAKKCVTGVGVEELEVRPEFQEIGVEKLWGLKKKRDEEVKIVLKKMQELEESICKIENGVEKVFRSLINTKVSLLNCLTQ